MKENPQTKELSTRGKVVLLGALLLLAVHVGIPPPARYTPRILRNLIFSSVRFSDTVQMFVPMRLNGI